MSSRILLAGLFHETHCFLEGTTGLSEFRRRTGRQLLDTHGDGSPLAAAVEVAQECFWTLLPSIDMRATPSATAEDAVFEEFWSRFSEDALRAAPVDGVYLVLHGAMACESIPDVEGELIRRLRQLPGYADVPIGGVLDLHGNISSSFATATQAFCGYRCNPHTDAHNAAARGARLLNQVLLSPTPPRTVYAQPAVMWPPTGTGTADSPMGDLEEAARRLEASHGIVAVNVFAGFSFADTHDTGVSVTAVTFGDPAAAQQAIDRLAEQAWSIREAGLVHEIPLDEACEQIVRQELSGPVILVEPSDNVGGGAPGDGTSVLRALLKYRLEPSGVIINDPQAVIRLGDFVPGETVELEIGGRGSRLTEGPLQCAVRLESKSDGRFKLEDSHSHLASMNGLHIDMGPSAVVSIDGVQVLLTSHKTPPFDLAQWRSQRITPERLRVIGVKAAVAHRRAYDPITAASFTVHTPGPCTSDLTQLPFTRVRRPVFPLDLAESPSVSP